jgi:hypothetical protein
MLDLMPDPGSWWALFSVTLVQIALGADNLITILANKLPVPVKFLELPAISWVFRSPAQSGYAVRFGPIPSHTGASMSALQVVTILLRLLLWSWNAFSGHGAIRDPIWGLPETPHDVAYQKEPA